MSRRAAERRLPELVGQDRDRRRRSARVSAGFERAAEQRVDAERLEQLGRRLRRVHAPRPVRRGQVRLAGRERADDRERARPLLELEELRRRHPELIEPHLRELARDVDQPIRLADSPAAAG